MKTKPTIQYWAIIPAAGIGERMQTNLPKQYLKLNDKTIIEHSVSTITQHNKISKVVVALHPDDTQWPQQQISSPEKIITTTGGKTRADSVMQGLKTLQEYADSDDWVLVHDAARPYLTSESLDRLIETLQEHPVGGLLAMPIADTLKKSSADGLALETISRVNLWAAQTPQMFRFGVLLDAMQKAQAVGINITDESSAVEYIGKHPMLIKGDPRNIKITRPEDISLITYDTVE